MAGSRLRSLLAASLALLILAPATAGAYKRSVSRAGVQLWWAETRLVYYFDESCCADVEPELCFDALQYSFEQWDLVECDDAPFRMDLVFGGYVSGRSAGYDLEGENENLVIFVNDPEDWAYSDSAIAMTSVTHDVNSGRIYDTDVEFNDARYTFTTDNLPIPVSNPNRQDIANTTTHEVGHMLGLDHSSNSLASMYFEASGGERIKRELHSDDKAGLCTIEPPEGSGFEEGVKSSDDKGCECSAGSARPRGPVAFVSLLAMLGLAAVRRR